MSEEKQKMTKPAGYKPRYIGKKWWEVIPMNEPHKRKFSRIENDAFKIGVVKHSSQFTKSLKNIANYAQIKYNNDVAEAIR